MRRKRKLLPGVRELSLSFLSISGGPNASKKENKPGVIEISKHRGKVG
jgi:hypothetical protein